MWYKTIYTRKWALALLSFATWLVVWFAVPVVAEESDLASPEAAPKVLQAEIIIFRHLYDPAVANALYETQGDLQPSLPRARQIFISSSSTPTATSDAPSHDIEVVYDYNSHLLNTQLERLRASKNVEVLYHIAWRQPPFGQNDAPHIQLLMEQTNGLIDGVARVVQDQHSRLALELRYDLDTAPNSLPDQLTSSVLNVGGQQTTETTSVEQYLTPISRILHIKLSDLVPKKQLLYLDHPLIGAVATVVSVEQPEASTPAVKATQP